MTTFRARLEIPEQLFQRLQKILAIEYFGDLPTAEREALDFPEDEVLFLQRVPFEDGNLAEVGVFTGQNNAWVAYDLVDHEFRDLASQEIAHDLAGTCDWHHAGHTYSVEVVGVADSRCA